VKDQDFEIHVLPSETDEFSAAQTRESIQLDHGSERFGLSFLGELDSSVHEDIRLDCMGGFVVSMVYGFSRPTGDLDVLEIAPREAGRQTLELGMQGGSLHKKYRIYLDHVGVAHVPDDYEERLTEIFPKVFKHLRLFALGPYDLALPPIVTWSRPLAKASSAAIFISGSTCLACEFPRRGSAGRIYPSW
jgi:hypothetical protein